MANQRCIGGKGAQPPRTGQAESAAIPHSGAIQCEIEEQRQECCCLRPPFCDCGNNPCALLSPPACENNASVKTTATTHSIGAAGRGCGTVFFATFAGFGVVFIVLFGKVLVNDARPYLWRATDCTILESAVLDQPGRSGGGSAFGFTVRYSYEIEVLSSSNFISL